MKKFAIREVETLKTTAAFYNSGCCTVIDDGSGSIIVICGGDN